MSFPLICLPSLFKKTTLSTQGDLIWMLKINLFPNWTSETRAGERSVPLVGDKNMCLYKEAAMPLYMKNTLYLPPPTRISNPVLNFKKYPERKQLQYNPSQAAQVSAIQQKSCMNSFLFPVSWHHNVMKPHGTLLSEQEERLQCSQTCYLQV